MNVIEPVAWHSASEKIILTPWSENKMMNVSKRHVPGNCKTLKALTTYLWKSTVVVPKIKTGKLELLKKICF